MLSRGKDTKKRRKNQVKHLRCMAEMQKTHLNAIRFIFSRKNLNFARKPVIVKSRQVFYLPGRLPPFPFLTPIPY
jgi:hypothetical protein